MAWTDACKIEAVAQIDKRKEVQGGVAPAIKDLSKESGIPCGTLKRWYYPDTDYKSTISGTHPKPLETDPKPTPPLKYGQAPGPNSAEFTQANQIAIFVISHLERIMADDPQREAALNKVKKWVDHNLKGKVKR
jgi:hypothetical protein